MIVPGERKQFGPSRFDSLGAGDRYEIDSGMGGSCGIEFVGKTADGLYLFKSLHPDSPQDYVLKKEELHQKLYHVVAEGSHRGNIRFDGRSQGNPGALSYGYVIWQAGMLIKTTGCGIGPKVGTNNEAEYLGLIAALRKALDLGVTHASVEGDSQLVIRQMTGEYACNADNLIPLQAAAQSLAAQFLKCSFTWISRERNEQADELSLRAYLLGGEHGTGKMIERAREIVNNDEVRKTDDGCYAVRNYAVNIDAPDCNCLYFQRHGGKSVCKHIMAARMVEWRLPADNIRFVEPVGAIAEAEVV